MSLIKGIVTPDNIDKICKICLEEKPYTIPLDTTIEFTELNILVTISNILIKLTNSSTTFSKKGTTVLLININDK